MRWLKQIQLWLLICSSIEIVGICGLATLNWLSKGTTSEPPLIILIIVFLLTLAGAVASKTQKWIGERVRVRVALDKSSRPLPTASNVDEQISMMLEIERESCLTSLREFEHNQSQPGSLSGNDVARLVTGTQSYYAAAMGINPEDRTREQYVREVDEYIKELDLALRKLFLAKYVRSSMGAFRLAIENRTDRPSNDVELTIHVPNNVSALDPDAFDEDETDKSPMPPRKYGTGRPSALFSRSYLNGLEPSASSMLKFSRVSIEVTSTETLITYPAIKMRTYSKIEDLPEIHLLIKDGLPNKTIQVRWDVTAENAKGRASGQIILNVGTQEITPLDLIGDDSADSDN